MKHPPTSPPADLWDDDPGSAEPSLSSLNPGGVAPSGAVVVGSVSGGGDGV